MSAALGEHKPKTKKKPLKKSHEHIRRDSSSDSIHPFYTASDSLMKRVSSLELLGDDDDANDAPNK